jgi:uncharacterized protein
VRSPRVFRNAALLAVAIVGLPGLAIADSHLAATRTIGVTGMGEASGPPDQAQINAGVQIVAPTVAEASRQNQAIVERIMKALDEQGISKKDIQTTNYSVWPEQRHDPRGNGEITISGYNVSNVVNVTVADIDKLGAVLAAVTDAGANSIHGVNFGVKDNAALEQRARAAAMEDARARAESLAKLAGVKLGEVQSISMMQGGGFPMPMMGGGRMAMAEAAGVVPGISPGQLSVSVQVNVTYAIR